jgi:perosamine synthetase
MAIQSGEKQVIRQVPLFKIYWDDNDIERVTSVIKKGAYWAIGPEIKEFEKRVADYVGVKYALAVNSGTSALHTAIAAQGITKGDEVIVPSFTFIATANCLLFVGAKPVFAEIEGETYGLDPADVEKKITPRTKAIMPIHYGGLSCRIKELKKIAARHHLLLIEDAAESLGATVDGQKVCSFGNAAILSFCSPKVITMGEGGMLLTDSRDVYEKARLMYNHGRAETSDYFSSTERMEYITLGYNFRMSTMTAALGLSQMDKIDKVIQMRRDNAAYLTKKLSPVREIKTPREPDGFFHLYQMYTIELGGKDARDGLKDFLNQNGIGAKVYFDPVHLSLFYRREYGYKGGELPRTELFSQKVLTLPMYPTLTRDEMDYMVGKIKAYFAANPGKAAA